LTNQLVALSSDSVFLMPQRPSNCCPFDEAEPTVIVVA
jgi:hypothetical protein